MLNLHNPLEHNSHDFVDFCRCAILSGSIKQIFSFPKSINTAHTMDEDEEFLHAANENDADNNNEEDIYDRNDEKEENLSHYPLITAVVAGDLTSVKSLLEQAVEKNTVTNWGRTALWYAAWDGNLEIMHLLLDYGADKEKTNKKPGKTPLYIASYKGHLPIVQLLLEQGADMEKADCYGNTPLIVASWKGHIEVARYLLEQGVDRDKASSNGWTPLHTAAFHGHLELSKLLMVYGADLNTEDEDGNLPIDMGYLNTEEIQQAIRDEPRRRMDHGHKRATEQDRHPNAIASASAQQEEEEEVEPSTKKPRLNEGEAEEGKVAEEDEDSEPSDEEDD